jgi:acetyl-CoA C-acetyltransferase
MSASDDVVILSGCRTAIGTFGGAFKDVSAVELGTIAVREAVRRSGVRPTRWTRSCSGASCRPGSA